MARLSEFTIDDFWAGLFFTLFLVSYSAISPVIGWLGDRTRRTWLLGLGVGLWSLATVGTGLARSYNQIALARSLLGIGEALRRSRASAGDRPTALYAGATTGGASIRRA